MKRRRKCIIFFIFLILFILTSCNMEDKGEDNPKEIKNELVVNEEELEEEDDPYKEQVEALIEKEKAQEKKEQKQVQVDRSLEKKGLLIAIDPGHQLKGNKEKEAIGPGASETKSKVSSGTSGKITGIAEYELNLQVSLKLRDELQRRGYEVLLTREKNEVDISNSKRAQMANENGAAAFLRIHADGSEDPSMKGAMTICQTPENPYNGNIYKESKALSTSILDKLVESTGAKKNRIWETDSMTGINWCQVPSTIVEVGFMSNYEEDQLLATEDYQNKVAVGIANGVDDYFFP